LSRDAGTHNIFANHNDRSLKKMLETLFSRRYFFLFFTKEKQKKKNKRKIKEKKKIYTNKTQGWTCHWEKGRGGRPVEPRSEADARGRPPTTGRPTFPSSGTHLWTPHPPPDYQ
jgi:hypothetical protein